MSVVRDRTGNGAACDFDVVIVGYGPVGQVAANLLGQRGYGVAVFEVATSIYNLPRAAHFDAEIMRVFQSVGLAEAVLPACAELRGMHFLNAAGEKLFGFDAPEGPGAHGWPAGYMFYQPDLERALQAGVQRFPNVEVYRGHEVLEIQQGQGAVAVSARNLETGEEKRVSADYVWGCDGARSITRKTLGIDLEDLCFDQPWLVVDTMLKRDVDLPEVCHQICDPARPVTYVPSAGRHRRWEFMLLPEEDPAEMERPETVWRLLAPWVTPDDTDVMRAVVYSFHAIIASEYRKGRVFLLGDAAHQMPPFLGQGMCSGIRDAHNLVWKLDVVRAGTADEAVFDSYCEERARHVREIIKRAVNAGRIIQTTDRSVAEARDDRFLNAAGREVVIGEPMGGVDVRMPGLVAGIIDPEGSCAAGQMFPQPFVTAGGGVSRRLDEVLGDGFTVVAGSNSRSVLTAAATAAFGPVKPRLVEVLPALGCEMPDSDRVIVGNPEGRLQAWLDDNGAAVVRPDRYVYGTAKSAAELETLGASLGSALEGHGRAGRRSETRG